ncbi:MAG: hypothetical protein R3F11_03515 [Verrucomicrobiales bacterium]
MSDQFYIGTRKGFFRVEKSAGRWAIAGAEFLGDQVPMLLPDRRDGSVYAALHHGHFGGKLHHSPDGKSGWKEIAVPAYPPKPDDVPDIVDEFRKITVPWSLEMVWALEAGGFDQPGELWCGTIPGGLFRSADGGGSWELIRSLWDRPERAKWAGGGYDFPGIHSICVDPRDPAKVKVGISCGGVWATGDRGESWHRQADGMRAEYMPPEMAFDPDVQDPHRLVQCAAAPESFWVQHHNGIFKSTDGCASWAEIEDVRPSGFGFAVAVHPGDPQTAWFVPGIKDEMRIPADARVIVNRTRDGGASFEPLGRGLPQDHAYDIVFRHGLDVDASGERLAMGSSTGSLWVSEDGGDSWETINVHLPPIYCVRFA